MTETNTVRLDEIKETPLRDTLMDEAGWKADLSYCMVCGKCASVCPLHGQSNVGVIGAGNIVIDSINSAKGVSSVLIKSDSTPDKKQVFCIS